MPRGMKPPSNRLMQDEMRDMDPAKAARKAKRQAEREEQKKERDEKRKENEERRIARENKIAEMNGVS